jgi:beta-glucosidase
LELPEKIKAGKKGSIKVKVKNTGNFKGEEVVQLYLTDEKGSTPRPIRQLEGFMRISLKPGENRIVEFDLEPRQFSMIGKNEKRVIEPGWFTISVGGKQPGFSGSADAETTSVVSGRFKVVGKIIEVY